ncbi:MAG TPA: hypothetical protein VFY93_17795, partial [Planctomycetota bacterium]|nr:hypothetical protein [Planctomycetota bacterium]
HAIVLLTHDDEPLRPLVRFITDVKGVPLDKPFDADLRQYGVEASRSPIRKVLLKPAYKAL